MSLLAYSQLSLADTILSGRKQKRAFLRQINEFIHWKPIENVLGKYYPKGLSIKGRKAYPALLLLKMSLLQIWYNLSDYEVEEQDSDCLSFMQFCGMRLQDSVPDHSVLVRCRKELSEKHGYEALLTAINQQLEALGILVKQGVIVDAFITPSPRKPKGKKEYGLAGGGENEDHKVVTLAKGGVDKEATWVKKEGKLYYGYKHHVAVESRGGLVVGVHTTRRHKHETKELGAVLVKQCLKAGTAVLADKGYSSQENRDLLRRKVLKASIQEKKEQGKEPSCWLSVYNKAISKIRCKLESVFGSIKRWFEGGVCSYVGLGKTHSQHVLEGVCYNLYSAPNIFIKLTLAG